MRSPGTAPPFGAKRTGRSVLMPRIGIDAPSSPPPGSLNFTALAVSGRTSRSPASAPRRDALLLVVGIHGARDVGRPHLAAADRGEHVVDRGARQARQRAVSFSSEYSILARWHSRSTMRRPSAAYWLRTASRVARRMAARALPVTTIDSQAAGGAVCAFEVRISTSSPFCSGEDSGAILPLILAPTAMLPTSVCTA